MGAPPFLGPSASSLPYRNCSPVWRQVALAILSSTREMYLPCSSVSVMALGPRERRDEQDSRTYGAWVLQRKPILEKQSYKYMRNYTFVGSTVRYTAQKSAEYGHFLWLVRELMLKLRHSKEKSLGPDRASHWGLSKD